MNQTGRGSDNPSGGMQSLKAAAVILVVVLVGWLVLHRNPSPAPTSAGVTKGHSSHVATTTTSRPTTTTTVALIPAQSIKVQVLNGVGTGDLATEWSGKLKKDFGYDTLAPDNSTATVPASVIYVMTAGYIPEADNLATRVGLAISAVNTTIPAPAAAPIPATERAAPNLVLVIGRDLAGSA